MELPIILGLIWLGVVSSSLRTVRSNDDAGDSVDDIVMHAGRMIECCRGHAEYLTFETAELGDAALMIEQFIGAGIALQD